MKVKTISNDEFLQMANEEIISNGKKIYDINDCKICFSFIQIEKLPDSLKLNECFSEIIKKQNTNSYEIFVFLICVLDENITYEYQFTKECIKEIIHQGIISSEKDVIPLIEKRFLNSLSREDKIASIIRVLSSTQQTLATMESCTGGQLASDITSVSNASEILKESYVTYCNEAKIKLGVPQSVIEKYSVYSYETAREMANAVLNFANANIGVGITGQIGRVDPNNLGISDNQVWYAIKVNEDSSCYARKLFILQDGSRAEKKKIVTREIIESLYNILN